MDEVNLIFRLLIIKFNVKIELIIFFNSFVANH